MPVMVALMLRHDRARTSLDWHATYLVAGAACWRAAVLCRSWPQSASEDRHERQARTSARANVTWMSVLPATLVR